MKILLLGNTGQLGWELHRCLLPLGNVHAFDYPDINLAQPESLRSLIRSIAPNVIVNAAAYTAVDKAETEHDSNFAINAESPGVMAEEAKSIGSIVVHYSTDYVFDGTKGSLYEESDIANPLNAYGQSKLAGEKALQAVDGNYLILRTAWVYSNRRDSFVSKVLQWSRQNEVLKVVDDQVSNPTWARMLAEVTGLLLARGTEYIKDHKGLYHLAGSGYASRLDWAREILKLDNNPQEQKTRETMPASTKDFPTPATRPLFSALDCSKFEQSFNIRLPSWKLALKLAMTSL
ncbi:MAG: dTDP-4-dehydrorhamnose reductase [Anaerolineales bacterium]|nr:dTDP-4-dehydrorhamnose reductase [Anaerolineales bacterium]